MSTDLIYRLRQLSEAYPVEVWPALTDAERDSIAGLLDRASAGMGRHFSGVFKEAADALEARAQPVAAIPEAGQSVPEGWQLVPKAATEDILNAMHARVRILCDPSEKTADIQNDTELWESLLAAAPSIASMSADAEKGGAK